MVKPATGPLADAAARAAEGVPPRGGARPPPAAPPAARDHRGRRAADAGAAPRRTRPGATLLATPPRPPPTERRTTPATGLAAGPSPTLAHDLEEAATRLLALLRALEKAETRDDVIELLVGHLGHSHDRAGFFAVKGGELQPFALRPPPAGPLPTLLLGRASTFQDVVGTRLPYRGPVLDEATRALLVAAFGDAPAEMLALPVAIRDRVVGIAYADNRRAHAFDEQLAIAARAAGQALERILKSHKRAV